MKYATGADFRRALETRLRTLSQRDGIPLARLRKFVAFDRLLARLLHAGPENWVLKGGLALQLRLGERARTTKDQTEIEAILIECGEPEAVDDSLQTAPSKRLETLSGRFKKTTTGIAIAKAIGLAAMRQQCPLFDGWLTTVENLKGAANGYSQVG